MAKSTENIARSSETCMSCIRCHMERSSCSWQNDVPLPLARMPCTCLGISADDYRCRNGHNRYGAHFSPGPKFNSLKKGNAFHLLGYYAEHIAPDNDNRSNSTVRVKSDSKGIHLHNLSYAGPIVMGCGGKMQTHQIKILSWLFFLVQRNSNYSGFIPYEIPSNFSSHPFHYALSESFISEFKYVFPAKIKNNRTKKQILII